jgi:hypothetical protein
MFLNILLSLQFTLLYITDSSETLFACFSFLLNENAYQFGTVCSREMADIVIRIFSSVSFNYAEFFVLVCSCM